jgi:hypothetical protein
MKIQYGKELRNVNERDLFAVDVVPSWVDIPFEVVNKYPDFIQAFCKQRGIEVFDEYSYYFAAQNEKEILDSIIKEAEDATMTGTVKGNLEAATQEMMAKLGEVKENIKAKAGETAEEYIERVDDSLNVVKGAFGTVLGILDRGLGYTVLKNDILSVIEAGQYGTSKHDLFRMAKKCRDITDAYIKKVTLLGNPDKAKKLKDLFTNLKGESIFTKLFSTLYWAAKKVARKLRKWFQVDEEKSVIGAICRSLAGFAGILRAGVKLLWNTAKFAVSFIASGVIAIADFIINAIKTLVNKIKGWATKKDEIIEEDEEYIEEYVDLDEIFEN